MEKSTFLPCAPERCIAEVLRPRLLHHVAFPLVRFVPINPAPWPDEWKPGAYWVKMRLFYIFPMGRQKIGISFPVRSDSHLQMRARRPQRRDPHVGPLDHQTAPGGAHYTDSGNPGHFFHTFGLGLRVDLLRSPPTPLAQPRETRIFWRVIHPERALVLECGSRL